MPQTTNIARRMYFLDNWKRDAKLNEEKRMGKLARLLDQKAQDLGYKNWSLLHLDVIRTSDEEFDAWLVLVRQKGLLPKHIAERERERARKSLEQANRNLERAENDV